MIAVEVFVQGEFLILISERYWSTLEFMLCSQSALVYFYLPCCWPLQKPITSVEFKFVARQVEASLVIRAAKPKFVAESGTRVYFAQHVVSSCNIVFQLRHKLVTNVVTPRATMCFNLQCNNVARQVEEKCCPITDLYSQLSD